MSEQQTCAVPDRNIFDALLAYRDGIEYVRSARVRFAAVLSVDFKNVFRRVSHAYLRKVVRNLLGCATSRVRVNDQLTPPFPVRRSVRQGCPLSMALFAVAGDPLLRAVTAACRGVAVGGRALTCRAYADDVGVLVGCPEDVDTSIESCRVTNAPLERKTVLLPLTPLAHTVTRDWFCVRARHKVLGVLLTANPQQMEALNWRPALDSVRAVLRIYAPRRLVLRDKVSLVARAWFLAQVLPAPMQLGRAIQQAAYWFLWRGSICKLSNEVCTLSSGDGGMGLVHFRTRCAALLWKRTAAVMEKNPFGPTAALFGRYRPASHAAPVSVAHVPFYLNHVRRFYLDDSYQLLTDVTSNKVRDIAAALRGTTVRSKWEYRLPWVNWSPVWKNLAAATLPSRGMV